MDASPVSSLEMVALSRGPLLEGSSWGANQGAPVQPPPGVPPLAAATSGPE